MTLNEALIIIHSLGYASKMPCRVYSTSAYDCNRGSKLREIEGSVCNKCYARRGNFARPSIQVGLKARAIAMDNPHWSEAMGVVLTALEHSGYFRWYASGDLRSLADLLKICDVAKRTPHITHWLPTHEIGILGAFARAGFTYPDNLIVRLSADMIEQKPSASIMEKLGVWGAAVSKTDWTCPAPSTNNACQLCRKCWQKSVRVVTYKYH